MKGKEEKVAVIIREKDRQWEGLRSSLGLLLENHQVDMYVLNHEVEMTDEYKDNFEFLVDMEGGAFSNVKENEKYGFKILSEDEIAKKLGEYTVIIPF
ncbi:MAG: hypothetical protein DRN25_06645 [Thermoplasmata archaeon]|nr:MAG: hypothetical protein DRN25_06645 [Thermoplasmata archaeon]